MISGEEKTYKEPSEQSELHFDEPERAAWIAKIDRLQRIQLRLTDKMEFLQEHCFQLTEELNKKSRIIQNKPIVCLGNTLMISGEEKPYKEPSEHSESHFDEPERAAWIAKIDRLQRIQLRLTDKMEFLQEHCFQLTEELNKKSRIIQSFVLAQKHFGSAAPNSVDANRARIAQTGGLMASLYGGKHSKDAYDRDTYLEICQKLQAVLEDTLFKNITLKENMATLGSEISSLNNMMKEIRGGVCENCRQVIHNLKPTPPTSLSSHSIASIPKPVSRLSPEPPTFCGGGVHANSSFFKDASSGHRRKCFWEGSRCTVFLPEALIKFSSNILDHFAWSTGWGKGKYEAHDS
ncbi:hypothetical protein X801_06630, partial [Opisthorchis viverrini]